MKRVAEQYENLIMIENSSSVIAQHIIAITNITISSSTSWEVIQALDYMQILPEKLYF